MTIYEFMSESPYLSFSLAIFLYGVFRVVFFILPNRILRHMNIRKHGYPPIHCDADGDFRPIDKKEDDDNV